MRPESAKQLFGTRAGRLDPGGVLLDEAVARGPVDLPALFGCARPVELEIGTGKGTFLLARAAARPEVSFLGLERARAYCRYAADRVRRAGLGNVLLLRVEAGHFFRVCLPDACLFRVHVYFPDPWPKRRHRRRRLIQPAFAAEVRRALRPGGQLIVVTDHLDYFSQIRRVLCGAGGLAAVSMPRMAEEGDELVGSNFERKYIAQGRAFYAAAWMRYV